MASRPFQISAWGVKPRFQELSSSALTGSGPLTEVFADSAMSLASETGLRLVRLFEVLLSSDDSGSENNSFRKQKSQKTTVELS